MLTTFNPLRSQPSQDGLTVFFFFLSALVFVGHYSSSSIYKVISEVVVYVDCQDLTLQSDI